MKGGQQACRLETPSGTGHFSDWPMAGAPLELGAPRVSSEDKAWGNGSMAVSANSAGWALKGRDQLQEQRNKGAKKEEDLLVHGNVLPAFQQAGRETVTAQGLLPLVEGLEVYAKPA